MAISNIDLFPVIAENAPCLRIADGLELKTLIVHGMKRYAKWPLQRAFERYRDD